MAVIGATEDLAGVGRSLVTNLKQTSFGGAVYPVNPKRSDVLGLRCYASVRQIPERIDLAVIATPARTVPGIIRECVEAGAEGAIIISAGFKEVGEKGAALEQEVLAEARKSKMRVIGPNCLGVMSPHFGLNATFASSIHSRSESVHGFWIMHTGFPQKMHYGPIAFIAGAVVGSSAVLPNRV